MNEEENSKEQVGTFKRIVLAQHADISHFSLMAHKNNSQQ